MEGGGRRPWLVISNDQFPGQGQQYLCCAMTSGITPGASFIPLDPERDWENGGTTKRSQIDTETLITMKQRWIATYSGRLVPARLSQARRQIKTYF